MAVYIPKAPVKRLLKDQGIERVSDEIVDILVDDIEVRLIDIANKVGAVVEASGAKTAKAKHLAAIKNLL